MDYRDIVLTLAEVCMDKVELDPRTTTPHIAADVAREIASGVRDKFESQEMSMASEVVLELTLAALDRAEVSFDKNPSTAGEQAAEAYLHFGTHL